MTNKNKDREKIPEAVVEVCRLPGTAVENCGIMLDNAFAKCNFPVFDYNNRGFETYRGKARGLRLFRARPVSLEFCFGQIDRSRRIR